MTTLFQTKIINSYIIKLFLSFCLLAFSYISPILAQKDSVNSSNYLLIINSYTEAAPWSFRMISAITEYAQNSPQLALYTEHMNMLMMDTDSTLNEFRQAVLEKYKRHSPRMLILLGNSSMILRDDFRKMWGNIPIILCAEEDYIGPKEFYLQKKPVELTARTPIADMAQPYNLTFLHSNFYIKENIDLICRMTPDIKNFIFIGDERQNNQTYNMVIKQELKKSHPDINYQFISPRKMQTNHLLDTLYTVDPKTTGILFSSWFYKHTFAGNTSLVTNSHLLVSTTSAPLFSLGMMTIKDNAGGIIGGYIYDQHVYSQKIIQTIQSILNGKQASEIPFYEPSDAAPTINYNVLLRKGMSPYLCPPGTIFFNKPPTFWEQYGYFILGTIVCFILLALFFQYRISHLNKLKKIQQKEIDTMTSYKNLINNMPILYMQEELIMNEEGTPIELVYRNVNAHFEKSFFRKEDVVGKKASEIFPESMPEFLHFTKMSLAENKAITFPYYFKQIDTFYDVVLKGTHHNNIVDIFCLDSTELHKAQQKLSATNNKLAMALDVANIVPWKWDLRSKTILCDINRPIELSTNDKDVNEEQLAVPDSQYFSKIFKEDRKRVEKAYDDLIEGRSDKVREEYRVINVQNNIHRIEWVEAQAAVETRDENGKPLTLVASLVITTRKKMEMELTTARDRAEESNRLKSAFLANMSHEIRTPLNAIVGFSGILASTDEEEEKQEYVSIIENNNTLLLQLISDILDLSKIEAGTLEFQYSNIDLNKMLNELTSSLQLKIKSEKVQLTCHLAEKNCFIHTEKNRLSQLLINLISNAIKFTTEGYIRFGYELRGKEIYFYVSDTGCGIPKDKQKSIFGRFVKLNSFEQGTGLGLSICQTLVEHMGGTIGVDSEEGKGSTFWFTLPYKAAIAVEESIKKEEIQPISIEKNKFTILIAEDNESNYKLFASILKGEYQLIHAWDGQEAVEMFKQYNPQIILMDINMPVMDGYEATKEIRKYSAKVPIIAITAFAYASDEQRVMESGFDGYMPKPINARLLKAQLTEIMQKRIILL